MTKFSKRRKFVNQKKRIMYFSLFFLVLFISVGYAYFNASLSINGNTTISSNIWDIHFANLSVTSGSATATTPATINANTTSISYSVSLSNPGDYYEFSVDVVNGGTIPGIVSLVNINGISAQELEYLNTSIKYTTGESVNTDDILNPNSHKRIIVRVAYTDDLSNLPSTNLSLDLSFNINYVQTNEDEVTMSTVLQELIEDGTYFSAYTNNVTDSVGNTKTASNVYFVTDNNYRNIIFGGFCWQIIRTTDNGGIKVIYNGEPVNDKCESSRGTHKGIIGTTGGSTNLNGTYLYGSSFTYDTSTNNFTLVDTETASFSESTAMNLISKYTCKTSSNTCSSLYSINGLATGTTAYTTTLTIGDVHYAAMSQVPFNANYLSPSSVGYMFGEVHNRSMFNPSNTTYKFGSTFTYNSNTKTYTLSGTTRNISTWSSGYNQINNTHYTCFNSSGTCTTYILYVYATESDKAYALYLDNGENINDVLTNLLSSNSVNYYDSTIKGVIDVWYKQHLLNFTPKIEDTVYCNARNITSLGGFNPSGGSTTSNYDLKYKNNSLSYTLDCPNVTDQFSVSNNLAKLTYPVALLTHEELAYYRSTSAANALRSINDWYWDLSPYSSSTSNNVRGIESNGTLSGYHYTGYSANTRPAITIKSSTKITKGTGSETDPWITE